MNVAAAASKVKCRPFMENECLTGLAISIKATAEFVKRGSDFFVLLKTSSGNNEEKCFDEASKEICFRIFVLVVTRALGARLVFGHISVHKQSCICNAINVRKRNSSSSSNITEKVKSWSASFNCKTHRVHNGTHF